MKPLREMHLVVISHKVCWTSDTSPSGFATDGGFPFQMKALSELFHRTTLVLPKSAQTPRAGLTPLTGNHLDVIPLPEPRGAGITRKLRLLPWLARAGRTIHRAIDAADAVHAPIPGDVGTLGMLLASARGKPLFVRYCGNWDRQQTVAERFWRWFLERRAGKRTAVLATGARDTPPSARNPNIRWIFASSLTDADLAALAKPRNAPDLTSPRIVTVGRQEPSKGTEHLISALALLRNRFPGASLDVIGDGSALPVLRAQAERLGLAQAIRFHGQLSHPDVLARLREATLFCLPSESEGFPKVVAEALASSLPVVVTDLPVLRTLLRTGGGQVLSNREPVAIADALAHCLESPDRYQRLSTSAREAARPLTLDRWRDGIGAQLEHSWGAA